MPIIVARIDPGSAADGLIPPGAAITVVNDERIDDPIDFMFAAQDCQLDISFVGRDKRRC